MIVDRQDHQGLLARARWTARFPGTAIRSSAIRAIPTRMKMNSEYFVALAKTFEEHYGVEFEGIRKGAGHRSARAADPVQDQHRRRDVGARPQRPGRLAGGPAGRRSATRVKDDVPLHFDVEARSVPGRAPARRQSSRGAAEGHGQESRLGRGEAGRDRAVPQAGRSGRARGAASRKSSSG